MFPHPHNGFRGGQLGSQTTGCSVTSVFIWTPNHQPRKGGIRAQPCVWMRRGNISKNIKEVWRSGPGIIWSFYPAKVINCNFTDVQVQACEPVLIYCRTTVPKLYISHNKGLQRGASPTHLCDCTKYEWVCTANPDKRGARASCHVSETKNVIWTTITGQMK